MSSGIIGQVGLDRFMALKYYYSGPTRSRAFKDGKLQGLCKPNPNPQNVRLPLWYMVDPVSCMPLANGTNVHT